MTLPIYLIKFYQNLAWRSTKLNNIISKNYNQYFLQLQNYRYKKLCGYSLKSCGLTCMLDAFY